ncbi:MAG: hypothetical protein CR986_04115 [Ignavibacteriae bacterium]|nr:MAG: hypothetical protein CR986_04115 [Ignavibacteriota bacterium]
MDNKNHWYDGIFYDKLIAPNQDKIFEKIKSLIPKDSSLLDVGCGTGRLAFKFSEHCSKIVGIDLSLKNISIAQENCNANYNNIEFIHGDAIKITKNFKQKFDYAVLTYVIHEMPEKARISLLEQLKILANNIIIGDYLTPTPRSIMGGLNVAVEFLAGKDHYSNFKSYVKNGGIDYLAEKANLNKIKEIKNEPSTAQILVLK